MLDAVDLAASLDLDCHGLAGGVFAEDVDRANGREILAANQRCAFFENLQLVGEQFLQVSLDAVFLQARLFTQVVIEFVNDFVNRHIKNVGGLGLRNSPNLDHASLKRFGLGFLHRDGAGRVHPVERLV